MDLALLTGATGFVGSALYPELSRVCRVRCASRDPRRARTRHPDREWTELDVEREATLRPALEGVDTAYYLVHGMGGRTGGDYEEREARGAHAFARAAAEAGVRRIVYLGGVAPSGEPSKHLRSRMRTGALLREGPVRAVELRAGMIVGAGSESWHIVRDLLDPVGDPRGRQRRPRARTGADARSGRSRTELLAAHAGPQAAFVRRGRAQSTLP